jgi:cell division protein FtsB
MASKRTERWARKGLLWGGIVVGLVLLFFLARGTWSVFQKMHEARDLRQAADEEVASMENRKSELETELSQLATPRGIESEIRARYPLVKPGEQEYILVDNTPASVDSTSTARESVWGAIRHWFGW